MELIHSSALKHGDYSVFAAFGECTRKGNDLYREMIADSVIKLVHQVRTRPLCVARCMSRQELAPALAWLGSPLQNASGVRHGRVLAAGSRRQTCACLVSRVSRFPATLAPAIPF